MKFISGNSGEHKISPDNENLSPYFDSLSPVLIKLSPEENRNLSTKTNNSGDTGHTGDKLNHIMEGKNDVGNNSNSSIITDQCINCPITSGHRIGHSHPFYYCKEHPKFQNINYEEIKRHIQYSKVHQTK